MELFRTLAPRLRRYRPFTEARAFVRLHGLKSGTQWRSFTKSGKLPKDIPSSPWGVYKEEGWISMGDWLGTGRVADQLRKYRSFKKARLYPRSLKLKSQKEWRSLKESGKLPQDIPANPDQTYRTKGWLGFGDWLGTGKVAHKNRVFLPFILARDFARKLNLSSRTEWLNFTKSGRLPSNIPTAPWRSYKSLGWIDWVDWLGLDWMNLSSN